MAKLQQNKIKLIHAGNEIIQKIQLLLFPESKRKSLVYYKHLIKELSPSTLHKEYCQWVDTILSFDGVEELRIEQNHCVNVDFDYTDDIELQSILDQAKHILGLLSDYNKKVILKIKGDDVILYNEDGKNILYKILYSKNCKSVPLIKKLTSQKYTSVNDLLKHLEYSPKDKYRISHLTKGLNKNFSKKVGCKYKLIKNENDGAGYSLDENVVIK